MADEIRNVRVRLSAEGQQAVRQAFEEVSQGADRAGNSAVSAGQRTARVNRDAAASTSLLARQFGVGLPQAVSRYVASLRGVETAMAAAFTGVAVLAIGTAIARIIPKIIEFTRQVRDHGHTVESLEKRYESLRGTVEAVVALANKLPQAVDIGAQLERTEQVVAGLRARLAELRSVLQAFGRAAVIPEDFRRRLEFFPGLETGEQARELAISIEKQVLVAEKLAERLKAVRAERDPLAEFRRSVAQIDPALAELLEGLDRLGEAGARTGQRVAAGLSAAERHADEVARTLREAGLELEQLSQAELDAFLRHFEELGRTLLAAREELEQIERATREYETSLDRLAAVIRSQVQTELERYNSESEKLNELLRTGRITTEEYSRALDQLGEGLARATGNAEDLGVASDGLALRAADFQQAMGSAFESAIFSGRGLRDVLQGLLADIGRMILRATILRAVFGALGFAGGGGVKPAAAPGAQHGGMIDGPRAPVDSVPIWATGGEYVVRQPVVRQPGVLRALEDLNRRGAKALRDWDAPGFATGGLVHTPPLRVYSATEFALPPPAAGGPPAVAGPAGAPGGVARADLSVELDEALLLKRLSASPEFDRIIVRALGRSPKAAKNALGLGVQ